jgi:hypothetical protein
MTRLAKHRIDLRHRGTDARCQLQVLTVRAKNRDVEAGADAAAVASEAAWGGRVAIRRNTDHRRRSARTSRTPKTFLYPGSPGIRTLFPGKAYKPSSQENDYQSHDTPDTDSRGPTDASSTCAAVEAVRLAQVY